MALDIHPDLPPETVPRQKPGIHVEKIPCCFLLKDAGSGNVVKLNRSGMMIWQTCTGEWTVGEIIDALTEHYPDAAESMAKDVYRTLDTMREEGVISLT